MEHVIVPFWLVGLFCADVKLSGPQQLKPQIILLHYWVEEQANSACLLKKRLLLSNIFSCCSYLALKQISIKEKKKKTALTF